MSQLDFTVHYVPVILWDLITWILYFFGDFDIALYFVNVYVGKTMKYIW